MEVKSLYQYLPWSLYFIFQFIIIIMDDVHMYHRTHVEVRGNYLSYRAISLAFYLIF